MAVPQNTIYYALYDSISALLPSVIPNEHQKLYPMIAGILGRSAAASITLPFELLRTQRQALGTSKKSTFFLLKEIYQCHGITGLWRGYIPTLVRDVPFSAIYWSIYETTSGRGKYRVESQLHKDDPENHPRPDAPTQMQHFIGGATAGSISAFVTTPLDNIKTLVQVSQTECIDLGMPKPNSLRVAENVYANHGIPGFFRGAVPRLAKATPAAAVMMTSYSLFYDLAEGLL